MQPRITLGHLVRTIREGATWNDAHEFPSSQPWADELERVLSFLCSQQMFSVFLPRLRGDSRQRDAALAEARVAFFFHRNGFRILAWEPHAGGSGPGDLEIQWRDADPLFIEIKGPTWQSELSEDEHRDGVRRRLPKYLDGEVRSLDTAGRIIYAIDKALPKFNPKRVNVVALASNLFVSPLDVPETRLFDLLTDRLRVSTRRIVGGVVLFDAVCETERPCPCVEYRSRLIVNDVALRPLPEAVRLGFAGGHA